MEAHFDEADKPDTNSVDHDINIIAMNRGFLNYQHKDFEFIGPDRKPVSIDTIDQCIEIANTISSTKVPNCVEARFPIHSGLNSGKISQKVP